VIRISASSVGSRSDATVASSGLGGGFQTDTQISGTGFNLVERTLQPWQPSAGDAADASSSSRKGRGGGGGGLDDEIRRTGGARAWDQFAAQAHIKSTYRDDLYTTKLDTNDEFYKQHEKAAERIAMRIEKSATEHSHVLEERGVSVAHLSAQRTCDKA
jgi:PAB1-binding protein PBP1